MSDRVLREITVRDAINSYRWKQWQGASVSGSIFEKSLDRVGDLMFAGDTGR